MGNGKSDIGNRKHPRGNWGVRPRLSWIELWLISNYQNCHGSTVMEVQVVFGVPRLGIGNWVLGEVWMGMDGYGCVVWYGCVVRYGVVWYVWYDMIWYGMVCWDLLKEVNWELRLLEVAGAGGDWLFCSICPCMYVCIVCMYALENLGREESVSVSVIRTAWSERSGPKGLGLGYTFYFFLYPF